MKACGCEPATTFESIIWRQGPYDGFYCAEMGDACVGQWLSAPSNTIVIAKRWMDDSHTVKHEMLHAILGRGDHPPIFRRLLLADR